MLTILGAEGDGTLFDLLFSRPAGLLISLVYLAETSIPGLNPPGGDITALIINYGLPIALVVYFLIRDDRREKRLIREEAARRKEQLETELRKEEQEKEIALTLRKEEQKRAIELLNVTHVREERMAKRIDELEDYINTTMLKGLTESSKSISALAAQIDRLISVKKDTERK